jgi:hypothetical protein
MGFFGGLLFDDVQVVSESERMVGEWWTEMIWKEMAIAKLSI